MMCLFFFFSLFVEKKNIVVVGIWGACDFSRGYWIHLACGSPFNSKLHNTFFGTRESLSCEPWLSSPKFKTDCVLMLLCLFHSYPSNFSLRERIPNGKFYLYFCKEKLFFGLNILYIRWMMNIWAVPQVVGELANSELTASTLLSLAGDCNSWRPLLYWLSASAVIVWSLQLTVSNDLNVALLRCVRPQCLQIQPLHRFKCKIRITRKIKIAFI